jgi:hypothetical protein
MLAGCSSGGDTHATAVTTERDEPPSPTVASSGTDTAETDVEATDTPADAPYTVTVEPLGEVTFEQVSERYVALDLVADLFQTEYVAKQCYPEVFGEWPDDGQVLEEEQLFDRQHVADVINGDIDNE